MPLEKHVWEIMESTFGVIGPEAGMKEVIDALTEQMTKNPHAQGLLVVDANKRFLGIVTIKDVLEHMKGLFDASCQAGEKSSILQIFSDRCRIDAGKTAKEIMKKESVRVAPNDRLVDAMKKVMDDRVRIMPVVDGNRPVGVLYLQDLFHAMKVLMRP